jgi:hypothetical protein
LFEVKVISDGKNVALGKTASQGSTYKDRPIFNASKAVDGMDSGMFSHTADTNVWWEVDLNGTVEVDQVLIKNRYCGGPDDPIGCLCRLSHSSLILLSDKGEWVDGVLLGNTCGELEVVYDFAASSVSTITFFFLFIMIICVPTEFCNCLQPSTCTTPLTNETNVTSPTPMLVAKLTASDGSLYDRFGLHVAISGNTLVVGSYSPYPMGDSFLKPGSAYVYQYNETSYVWDQVAKLTASDGYFGYSVAISCNTIIVGAYGANNLEGTAYVYQYNETTNLWDETAKLSASDRAAEARFGQSVAVSDGTIVVGAAGGYPAKNCAYVYQYNKTSTRWDEVAKLVGRVGGFGLSVAVSGGTIAVGASEEKPRVYVYQYNETSTHWDEVAELKSSDGSTSEVYGISVAVSDDTVIAGACGTDHLNGRAYVYQYNKTSTRWYEAAKLTASVADNRFGLSVAISGTTVVVGAPGDESNKGRTYVYHNDGNGWNQVANLTAPVREQYDAFGISVSVSGTRAIIGASGDDDRRGSAFVATV